MRLAEHVCRLDVFRRPPQALFGAAPQGHEIGGEPVFQPAVRVATLDDRPPGELHPRQDWAERLGVRSDLEVEPRFGGGDIARGERLLRLKSTAPKAWTAAPKARPRGRRRRGASRPSSEFRSSSPPSVPSRGVLSTGQQRLYPAHQRVERSRAEIRLSAVRGAAWAVWESVGVWNATDAVSGMQAGRDRAAPRRFRRRRARRGRPPAGDTEAAFVVDPAKCSPGLIALASIRNGRGSLVVDDVVDVLQVDIFADSPRAQAASAAGSLAVGLTTFRSEKYPMAPLLKTPMLASGGVWPRSSPRLARSGSCRSGSGHAHVGQHDTVSRQHATGDDPAHARPAHEAEQHVECERSEQDRKEEYRIIIATVEDLAEDDEAVCAEQQQRVQEQESEVLVHPAGFAAPRGEHRDQCQQRRQHHRRSVEIRDRIETQGAKQPLETARVDLQDRRGGGLQERPDRILEQEERGGPAAKDSSTRIG